VEIVAVALVPVRPDRLAAQRAAAGMAFSIASGQALSRPFAPMGKGMKWRARPSRSAPEERGFRLVFQHRSILDADSHSTLERVLAGAVERRGTQEGIGSGEAEECCRPLA
jgi:hypothetical protein